MKPFYPFLLTGYHSPEYFCDREALADKEMLLQEGDRYEVYDRFFGVWLKENM